VGSLYKVSSAVFPKSKHMTFVDQTAMFNDAVGAFVHSRPSVPGD